jgi:hypothetical protein
MLFHVVIVFHGRNTMPVFLAALVAITSWAFKVFSEKRPVVRSITDIEVSQIANLNN